MSLKDHKFILREKGSATRDCFEHFLEDHKLAIEPYIESVSTQVIISCLMNNLGISILPFSFVREFVEGNQLKLLDFTGASFERTYNIIMLKNKVLSKVQQAILSTCLKFDKK